MGLAPSLIPPVIYILSGSGLTFLPPLDILQLLFFISHHLQPHPAAFSQFATATIMYKTLEFTAVVNSLNQDEQDSKECSQFFEEFKEYFEKHLREQLEEDKNAVDLVGTGGILVGDMSEGVSVGVPHFELIYPFSVRGAKLMGELKDGQFRVNSDALQSAPEEVKPHLAKYVVDRVVQACALRDRFISVFTTICNGALENFRKFSLVLGTSLVPCGHQTTAGLETLTMKFRDKRSGLIILSVSLEPVLQIATSDGMLLYGRPDRQGSKFYIHCGVRERDLVIVWDKGTAPPNKGIRKSCLRLLKAYVMSHTPNFPTYPLKILMMHELRKTKNSDAHWSENAFPARFTDMLTELQKCLQAGRLATFHVTLLGNDVNVLEGIPGDVVQETLKKVNNHLRTPDQILQTIKVSTTAPA